MRPETDRGCAGRVYLTGTVLAVLLAAVGCQTNRLSVGEFRSRVADRRSDAPSEEVPGLSPDVAESFGPLRLGPMDVISVSVTPGDQSQMTAPTMQRVSEKGTIDLPMIDSVEVGGLNLAQAERKIKDAYQPDVYQRVIVHVELIEPSKTSVLVVGAGGRPRLVELRRDRSDLLHALDAAEGAALRPSGVVSLKRVNDPDTVATFDLREPKELIAALSLPPLENGDIVFVGSDQPNTIFVGGLVMAPGPQMYPPGAEMTALQALAAAGGPRPDLLPPEATLIRRIDGEEVRVKLDLNRLMNGDGENLTLSAGDIFWVPHTASTRMLEFVNNTLYLSAGVHYDVGYSNRGADYRGDLERTGTSVLVP